MLSKESCEACRVGAPEVPESERANLLSQIPGWELVKVGGVDRLVCAFTFKNFVAAIAFANQVGELAERLNHHPELVVEWGRVKVSWWTHKIKGLHRNDFIAAAKTTELMGGGN